MNILKVVILLLVVAILIHMISLFVVGTVIISSTLLTAFISNPLLSIIEFVLAIIIGYLAAVMITLRHPKSI